MRNSDYIGFYIKNSKLFLYFSNRVRSYDSFYILFKTHDPQHHSGTLANLKNAQNLMKIVEHQDILVIILKYLFCFLHLILHLEL